MKAKSYSKKRNLVEAQKLYQSILKYFPKNKRAQDGLLALNKLLQNNIKQNLPQKLFNELIQKLNAELNKRQNVYEHPQMIHDYLTMRI